MIDSDGNLFTFGFGEFGQLGSGANLNQFSSKKVVRIDEKIKSVACGLDHTLALSVSGRVYAFGSNTTGQLGLGDRRSTPYPTMIQDIAHIEMKMVAASSFSAALSSNKGDLYLWGKGTFGENLNPVRVKSIDDSPMTEVNLGSQFGAVLSDKGLLYTWGTNDLGQLSQGDNEDRPFPTLVYPLRDKKVTTFSCGGSYILALGATMRNPDAPPHPSKAEADYAKKFAVYKTATKSKSRTRQIGIKRPSTCQSGFKTNEASVSQSITKSIPDTLRIKQKPQ